MSTPFLRRFHAVAEEHGWANPPSPSGLLQQWGQFVEECEAGYGWSIYEFDDELSARDLLAKMLEDTELARHPEAQELSGRVAEVDRRFKELLRSDVEVGDPQDPWWRRGVLRSAGSEYAADAHKLYGVQVERV